MEIKAIREKLNQQAENVCRKLLPDGKKESRRWIVGSLNGEKGRSLSVPLEGHLTGHWQDFSTGERGDLIDLWVQTQGKTLPDALTEIKQYLSISEPSYLKSPKREYKRPAKPNNKPSNTVVNYLTQERKLTVETLKQFKIESDSEYYCLPSYKGDELVSWKKISINRDEKGKKKMFCSPESEPILFGWQALDPTTRVVYLTEGEIDAMSLHQLGFPALSIPFGTGNGEKMRWLESEFSALERFEEIYICFDSDDKGQASVKEYASRLGIDRTFNIKLPMKDANECLKSGYQTTDMINALKEFTDFPLESVKKPKDFLQETIRMFYPTESDLGIPLPFGNGTEFNFRPSELTVWSGTNGHGKSLVLSQIMLDLISRGERVFLASMELKPTISLKRLVRQATAMRQPSEAYIGDVLEWCNEGLLIYDVLGDVTPDKLLESMRQARQRHGVTHFVIDSLMKCGIDPSDYGKQKTFVGQLCEFRSRYDCHIHLVAHVRKGENEHQIPDKLDVSGSSDISNQPDNQIAVWRNKAKEEEGRKPEPDEKKMAMPDGFLIVQKQRNGEWEGRLPVWFDLESNQYLPRSNSRPKRYVQYENSVRLVSNA